MGKEPHVRDWMREAYLIARGDKKINPKKEHIIALVQNNEQIRNGAVQMKEVVKQAYMELRKKYEDKGLEPPPLPPQWSN